MQDAVEKEALCFSKISVSIYKTKLPEIQQSTPLLTAITTYDYVCDRFKTGMSIKLESMVHSIS